MQLAKKYQTKIYLCQLVLLQAQAIVTTIKAINKSLKAANPTLTDNDIKTLTFSVVNLVTAVPIPIIITVTVGTNTDAKNFYC